MIAIHGHDRNLLFVVLALQGDLIDHAQFLRSEYPEALNALGAALHNQRRYEDAEKAIRAALELRPRFPLALNGLGNTLRRLHHPEAGLVVAGPIRGGRGVGPRGAGEREPASSALARAHLRQFIVGKFDPTRIFKKILPAVAYLVV